MSNYDPEHPYSEEPTRATPRLDPNALSKPHTQPIDGSSGTREVPFGSPPPDRSYGQSYGQGHAEGYGRPSYGAGNEQYNPYGGNGYDPSVNDQSPQNPYGAPQQYGQPAQYGAPQYPNPYGNQYGNQYDNQYGYAPPGGFPQQPQTNGMAIAALVTSLAGCLCGFGFPIGLVLGFMALPEAKRQNDSGSKGMAIAGIVIGGLGTLLIVGYIVLMVVWGIGSS